MHHPYINLKTNKALHALPIIRIDFNNYLTQGVNKIRKCYDGHNFEVVMIIKIKSKCNNNPYSNIAVIVVNPKVHLKPIYRNIHVHPYPLVECNNNCYTISIKG